MMKAALKHFRADESGASALEAIIIVPALIWVFVSSFVFFDAFRTYNSSVKATYTVADILSRQTRTVTAFDIEGMAELFNNLVRNGGDVRMRVTQIRYTAATDTMAVEWSYATNNEARLFTANLADMEELLPQMADAERLLLVETFIPYRTAFDLGLDLITFRNFNFTRPRFAGQVPFDETITSAPALASS